jgi:hypothetical protein
VMTTRQAARQWEGASGKVGSHHRDRLAVVYVRQSTTPSAKSQSACR